MKDEKHIERIIKYIEKINTYMKSVSDAATFQSNPEKIDAVMLNLEQIGETAKKLSAGMKRSYPDIEWVKIIALRNLISHEYEGINVNVIYDIVTIQMSELLVRLKTITV